MSDIEGSILLSEVKELVLLSDVERSGVLCAMCCLSLPPITVS